VGVLVVGDDASKLHDAADGRDAALVKLKPARKRFD